MYPTKSEIINALPETQVDQFIETVEHWKTKHYKNKWQNLDQTAKLLALVTLVTQMSNVANNKTVSVKIGKEYRYNMLSNQITLGFNPSIVSTLHEFGHAEWGPSELDACRFSVKLFMTVFPKEYANLSWRGHLLVKA